MTGTPVRIVIAAVNQLYRKTLTGIIQTKPNLQVVAEEEDGFAAIQAVEKHKPDVVLMGVSLPVLNGIDATWVIKSKFPDVGSLSSRCRMWILFLKQLARLVRAGVSKRIVHRTN